MVQEPRAFFCSSFYLLLSHQNDWPGAVLGAGFNEWLEDSESSREVGTPLIISRSPGTEGSGLQ